MEREFAIQSQITEAARRLASDPHISSKKLKKQRKTSYLNALKKLQDIENGINEYRVRSGKKPTQRASLIIEGEEFCSLCLFGRFCSAPVSSLSASSVKSFMLRARVIAPPYRPIKL